MNLCPLIDNFCQLFKAVQTLRPDGFPTSKHEATPGQQKGSLMLLQALWENLTTLT